MSCTIEQVKVDGIEKVKSIFKGEAKSITFKDNLATISYGPEFKVKTYDSAYKMVLSNVERINKWSKETFNTDKLKDKWTIFTQSDIGLNVEFKFPKSLLSAYERKLNEETIKDSTSIDEVGQTSLILESKKNLLDLVGNKNDNYFGKEDIQRQPIINEKENLTDEIIDVLFRGQVENTDAVNILNNIVNSGLFKNDSKLLRIISKLQSSTKAKVKIVKTSELKNPDTYMQYNSATNTIEIAPEVLNEVNNVEQALLNFIHEVFHERTLRILNRPKNDKERALKQSVDEFYTSVKDTFGTDYDHETSSVEEFTAGMLSNKVFAKEVEFVFEANKKFWNKLRDFFRDLFGFDNSYNKMLSNIINLIDDTNAIFQSDITLESKYKYNFSQPKVSTDKVNKAATNIVKTLDSLVNIVRKQKNTKIKETLHEMTESLSSLKDKFKDDVKVYEKEVIDSFMEFMTKQNHAIYKYLENVQTNGTFDSRVYENLASYNKSFINIEGDMRGAIEQMYKVDKDINKDQYEDYISKLRITTALSLELKQEIIFAAKNKIKNSDIIPSRFYRTVELEYEASFIEEAYNKGLTGSKADNYVNQKMVNNADKIKLESKEAFNALLDDPFLDISSIAAFMNSEKDFNNAFINIFSSVLENVKATFSRLIQPKLIELQFKYLEFTEGGRLQSTDKINENLIEWSKDGIGYLKGEYKLEFYDNVKKFINDIADTLETYGDESQEYKDAVEAYEVWQKDNITGSKKKPIIDSKWKNDLTKLSIKEQAYLKYIKSLANDAHKNYKSNIKGLRKKVFGAKYFLLPSINKETLSNVKSGNFISGIKEAFNETFKRRSDEDTEGELTKDGKTFKVFTDLSGKEIKHNPIHYRIPIIKGEQSMDLATIYALEYQQSVKYKTKDKVAADLQMFRDVIASGEKTERQGIVGRIKSSVFSKNDDPIVSSAENSNLVKMLDTILNNQLYDKISEHGGKIGDIDINKLESFIRSTTSRAALAFNFISGPTNLITGKSQSFLEVIGDPNLTIKDLLVAEQTYYKNIGGLMGDMGGNVHKSFVNQLMNKYGGLLNISMLQNSFEKNKAYSMATGLPFFFQEGSEHNIQAVHSMTILQSIKILNNKGEFINKDGQVVESKDEALSLLEAHTMENGQLLFSSKLPRDFRTTNNQLIPYFEGGEAFVRGYINTSLIKSQGNYGSEYISELQRHWYGNLLSQFKKHIISPTLRRWRGASQGFNVLSGKVDDHDIILNYNIDLKRPDEGNYVTALRFIKTSIIPNLKKLRFDLLAKDFKTRPKWEQANLARTMTEVAMLTLFAATAKLLAALASGDDDEIWIAAAIFRRAESEASQYWNINEAHRIIKNPIAGVRVIESTMSILEGIVGLIDFDEEDRDKALNKIYRGKRMLPLAILKLEDAKQSFDYINR